ncbi:hypothetical protein TRIP_D310165 [uncultured Paludibacter sp.]|uniref:Uncharacterized protein n=1 Tax=uncultured Paludibacter sp. TaxID=497635 RepID=A0A653ACI5_9BACT|nr:hypothetical protein TRIP_D310165 [uncultured Paludibacter sp.]
MHFPVLALSAIVILLQTTLENEALGRCWSLKFLMHKKFEHARKFIANRNFI